MVESQVVRTEKRTTMVSAYCIPAGFSVSLFRSHLIGKEPWEEHDGVPKINESAGQGNMDNFIE